MKFKGDKQKNDLKKIMLAQKKVFKQNRNEYFEHLKQTYSKSINDKNEGIETHIRHLIDVFHSHLHNPDKRPVLNFPEITMPCLGSNPLYYNYLNYYIGTYNKYKHIDITKEKLKSDDIIYTFAIVDLIVFLKIKLKLINNNDTNEI